ncbi:MAG: hypothetical protein ACOCXT_06300 [Candidatus Dojkabacteria bacterium]
MAIRKNNSLLYELLKDHRTYVQRIMGFLLDSAGFDTSHIRRLIQGKHGMSKMSEESKLFSAKWRLYYASLQGRSFDDRKGDEDKNTTTKTE